MPSGHVTKKGKNWYVVLELDNEDGERNRRWISVRKALGPKAGSREAKALLRKYLQEFDEGTYIEPNEITVKEYLLQWLEDYVEPNVKPTTYSSYREKVNCHIIPSLGHIELAKLRKSKIKGFLAEKQKPGARADGKPGKLSNRSVQYIFTVLKAALSHAVEDELIKKNPAKGITPPRPEKHKEKLRYWEYDQAKTFLNALKEHKDSKKQKETGHRLYPLYLLAITIGMRRGELLGLKWESIDFKKRTIKVESSLVAQDKGPALLQDSTKGGRDRIIEEIDPAILDILQAHRKKQAQMLMALGRPELDHGLVFINTKGKPIHPSNIDRQFAKLIKKYKLPKIRFHDLRHTAATIMLENGTDVKTVAEQLGHADAAVLLDIYSHVTKKMKKKAADSFKGMY